LPEASTYLCVFAGEEKSEERDGEDKEMCVVSGRLVEGG
jgi:hypothetical protein